MCKFHYSSYQVVIDGVWCGFLAQGCPRIRMDNCPPLEILGKTIVVGISLYLNIFRYVLGPNSHFEKINFCKHFCQIGTCLQWDIQRKDFGVELKLNFYIIFQIFVSSFSNIRSHWKTELENETDWSPLMHLGSSYQIWYSTYAL